MSSFDDLKEINSKSLPLGVMAFVVIIGVVLIVLKFWIFFLIYLIVTSISAAIYFLGPSMVEEYEKESENSNWDYDDGLEDVKSSRRLKQQANNPTTISNIQTKVLTEQDHMIHFSIKADITTHNKPKSEYPIKGFDVDGFEIDRINLEGKILQGKGAFTSRGTLSKDAFESIVEWRIG